MYSKQAPFTVTVGMLMVKLVPATIADKIGAVLKVRAVLQVLLSLVPSAADGVMLMLLVAVTAVVLTVQVPPDAATSQYTAPEGAAEHATTLGLAAVPEAPQFVSVAK